MSDYTPIPASRIPELRHTLVHYTRTVTPGMWASMLKLGQGGNFFIPSRWAHLPIDEMAWNLAQAEADRLETARLFSITAAATEEARNAGALLPRFTLHPSHLPAPHGFLVWGSPVDTARGVGEPVVACAWGPYGSQALWVSFYVDGSRVLNVLSRQEQDRIRPLLHPFGYEREIVLPFGNGRWFSEQPGMEQVAEDYEQPIRTLLATWLHMRQTRLTETTEEQPDRKSRVARTLAKKGRPLPPVRVVSLRPCSARDGAPVGSGRKLAKRVEVGSYWRRRPRTTGEGPDDMVWVRDHERGPKDAPRSGGEIVTRLG